MVQIIRAHLTFPSTGTTKNISLAHHSIQVVRQIILRATHALDPHWSIAVRESAWRPSPPKSATSRQRGRPTDRAYLRRNTHSSSALPVRGKHRARFASGLRILLQTFLQHSI